MGMAFGLVVVATKASMKFEVLSHSYESILFLLYPNPGCSWTCTSFVIELVDPTAGFYATSRTLNPAQNIKPMKNLGRMHTRRNAPGRCFHRRPRDHLPIPPNIPKIIKPGHRVRKYRPRRSRARQRHKVQRQHLNWRQLSFSVLLDDFVDGRADNGVRGWGENLRLSCGDGVARALVEDHVEGGEGGKTGDVGPGTEIGLNPLHRARGMLVLLGLLAQTNGFCGKIHVLSRAKGHVTGDQQNHPF